MSGFFISKTDVLGYLLNFSDSFSATASTQALLEFMIIGRIPLTDLRINFDAILSFGVALFWGMITFKLFVKAVKKLDEINNLNQIELIAL